MEKVFVDGQGERFKKILRKGPQKILEIPFSNE